MVIYLVANNREYLTLRFPQIFENTVIADDDAVVRFNVCDNLDTFGGRTDYLVCRKGDKFHGIKRNRKHRKNVFPKNIYLVCKPEYQSNEDFAILKNNLVDLYNCKVYALHPTRGDTGKMNSTGYIMWKHMRETFLDSDIVCVGFTAGNNDMHDMESERRLMRKDPNTSFC